ncbi:hypothetical protein [Acinetobacter sp. YH12073]|uniref:hypothetical protein n=1 Tax=Acinetobacter sp. YH12073 TaxID=2601069 RepID=UPI0015D2BAAD|nr:hypothetical protein [Acinetobacter sp. YH12073]
MKAFMGLFCLFLIVFDLRIIGPVGSSVLAIVIMLIYSIFLKINIFENLIKVLTFYKYSIFIFMVICFFVVFRILVDSFQDYSYFLSMMKATLILISSLIYIALFEKKDTLFYLFMIFFINSLICFYFGTYPENKFIIKYFSYPVGDGSVELIGANEYRNAFLAGSGYFGIAALYAFVFPVLLYYIVEQVNSNKYIYYIMLFVIACAGLMAGRVALLCYFISLITFLVFYRKISIIFYIAIGSFIFINIVNNVDELEFFKLWFLNLYSEGGRESSTIQELKTMFYMPDELTFLFGDGKFKGEFGGYYGSTDVGYMRNILFGGIFFCFFVILFIFSILFKSNKFFLIVTLSFIALLLHGKGLFIINNPGFLPIILLSIYYSQKYVSYKALK